MTLKVALRVDGDAAGAQKALGDTTRALGALQQKALAANAANDNALANAAAAAQGRAAAATDAHAAATGRLSGQMLIARRVIGGVLAQLGGGRFAAIGAGIAAGFGPQGLLVAGLAAAAAAAGAFFARVETGGRDAESVLKEHERILGLIKDRYSGAADAAAKFFRESKAVIELQQRLSLIELGEQLQQGVTEINKTASRRSFAPGQWVLDLFGAVGLSRETDFDRVVNMQFKPFEDAILRLRASVAQGVPDFKAFSDEIAAIGNAAAKAGDEKLLKLAGQLELAARKLRLVQGAFSQTEQELRQPGSTVTRVANEFDRATAAVLRRTQALESEAETFGMTAAAAGRYRIEQELMNAAAAAGITLNEKNLAAVGALAERYGAAAGRLDDLRQQAAASEQVLGGLFDAVTGDVDNATEALKRFIAQLLRAEARAQFLRAFNPAAPAGPLTAFFSALSGGSAVGAAATGVGAVPYHGGGEVGIGGMPRFVHAAYFEQAPRMHGGGRIDWAAGERPLIGKVGEVIGWPQQLRQAFGGGAMTLEIKISVDESGNIVPLVRQIAGAEADVRVDHNNRFAVPRMIQEQKGRSLLETGKG